MNPLTHPLCNDRLGGPAGSPHIPGLPIQRTEFEGVPVTVSFWKPTRDELHELNAGGCVAMHVMSSTHAPVSVRTEPSAIPEDEPMVLKDGTRIDLRAPWPLPGVKRK